MVMKIHLLRRLEVQADVTSTQRFSLCSETASAATSLSEKSVNASIAPDDGTASTRALAGSVLNMKLDALGEAAAAVPGTSQPMDSSSGQAASLSSLEGSIVPGYVTKRTRRRLAAEKQSIDGDSTEEFATEEVNSAKRPRRRPDKQQQHSLSAESSSISAEDGGSERVRFDHHVSFIEAEENGRSRDRRKKNNNKELEDGAQSPTEKQRSLSFLRRLFSR